MADGEVDELELDGIIKAVSASIADQFSARIKNVIDIKRRRISDLAGECNAKRAQLETASEALKQAAEHITALSASMNLQKAEVEALRKGPPRSTGSSAPSAPRRASEPVRMPPLLAGTALPGLLLF